MDRAEQLIQSTSHDTVYLIHHETTTGVLNPLKQIGEISKKNHKWLLVDAVSSIGGEELDLAAWGVDLVIGSANKCIRGVPGASFCDSLQPFVGGLVGAPARRVFHRPD